MSPSMRCKAVRADLSPTERAWSSPVEVSCDLAYTGCMAERPTAPKTACVRKDSLPASRPASRGVRLLSSNARSMAWRSFATLEAWDSAPHRPFGCARLLLVGRGGVLGVAPWSPGCWYLPSSLSRHPGPLRTSPIMSKPSSKSFRRFMHVHVFCQSVTRSSISWMTSCQILLRSCRHCSRSARVVLMPFQARGVLPTPHQVPAEASFNPRQTGENPPTIGRGRPVESSL